MADDTVTGRRKNSHATVGKTVVGFILIVS